MRTFFFFVRADCALMNRLPVVDIRLVLTRQWQDMNIQFATAIGLAGNSSKLANRIGISRQRMHRYVKKGYTTPEIAERITVIFPSLRADKISKPVDKCKQA